MKLKVVFRRAARAEFLDDAARYAELRADLGLDFVIEIDRCTSLISERPQEYPVVCQRYPHAGFRSVFTSAPNPIVLWS